MKRIPFYCLIPALCAVFYFAGCSKDDSETTPQPPAAPSNLTVTQTSATVLTLHWTDNSANEDSFMVERAMDSVSTGWHTLKSLARDVTETTDATFMHGHWCFYRVSARNGHGSSAVSNTASIETTPDASGHIYAAATQMARNGIAISWTAPAGNIDSFYVERATDTTNTNWHVVAVTLPTIAATRDTVFAPGTRYFYRVCSVVSGSVSECSSIISVTTWPDLPAPSNLTAAQTAVDTILLQWTDNSPAETGFRVERTNDTTGSQWQTVCSVGSNTVSAHDVTIQPYHTYLYRVRSLDSHGDGPCSNTARVQTIADLAPPTDLTITQTSRACVNLTWTDNSRSELFFKFQRSVDSVNWASAFQVGTDITAAADSHIFANRKAYYRVQAADSISSSAFSSVASIWTLPAVYTFATTNDLNMFDVTDVDTGVSYHTWARDPNQGTDGAGKLTITTPTTNQRYVRVVANSTSRMPNQGWFESRIRVNQWRSYGTNANYASFFVERDPNDPMNNVLGMFFSVDSTILGYFSDPNFHRLATNPTLPILSTSSWHRIQLFHQGIRWDVYIDNTLLWTGDLPNVCQGNYTLYEEWQFDKGGPSNPGNQQFWIDDVANPSSVPISEIPPQPSSPVILTGTAHRK